MQVQTTRCELTVDFCNKGTRASVLQAGGTVKPVPGVYGQGFVVTLPVNRTTYRIAQRLLDNQRSL